MPTLARLVDPLGLLPLAERTARGAANTAAGAIGGAASDALDRVLVSRWAGDVVDRIVASELAEHAVREVVAGPLVESAVRGAVERGLIERISDELLEAGAVERIAERVAAGPELDRLLVSALESARAAELAARVLESEAVDRLVAQIIDSPLVDATVARLLASDDLWLMVDEIARSPSVTEAISHQGVGFADQIAGEVGRRSRGVDDRLERAARRFLHRRPRPGDGPTPALGDGAP